jgi:hypothetical protein
LEEDNAKKTKALPKTLVLETISMSFQLCYNILMRIKRIHNPYSYPDINQAQHTTLVKMELGEGLLIKEV